MEKKKKCDGLDEQYCIFICVHVLQTNIDYCISKYGIMSS